MIANSIRSLYYLLIPLPCIIIGCLAMYKIHIPLKLIMQNIIIYILGLIISYFISRIKPNITKVNVLLTLILIGILTLTFSRPGLDSVHRWIYIGPISLHASMVILPFFIAQIYKIKNWWVSFFLALFISLILMFQPDASQNTAFVLSTIVVLVHKGKMTTGKLLSLIPIMLTSVHVWMNLDNLPSIAHVEGVLHSLLTLGALWYILGLISLIMLPFPFILCFIKTHSFLYLSFFVYMLTTIIAPLFGNFPFPILGHGASPIIGYFIACYYLNPKMEHHNTFRLF